MKKRILVAAICIAAVQQLHAQDSTIGSPKALEEVIIRENRFKTTLSQQNRNIRVMSKEEIAQLPVRSVNEVLSYVAGVDLRQRGPGGVQGDVGIDGGTFDETLVLINGIRMTDAQTGHNMMNLPITLDVVDHIEILRGAAARIYGVNALTGAINFVTKTPTQNALSITGYTGTNFENSATSDHDYNNWGGRITLSNATANTSHLLSLNHDNGNGYRANTAAVNDKAFYQGKFVTHQSDYLNVLAGYSYNAFGANAFYAAPGDSLSSENVRSFLAAVEYNTKITANWTFVPRISYRFVQDDYKYITNPPQYRNLHKNHIANIELNNTIHTAYGDIGLGLEGRTEQIISSNIGRHKRFNYGLSGEYKFADLGKFSLTAGAYLNYNSAYGWQLFPGLDAGYQFAPYWKWFANVGTGQRLPTFTDLFYTSRTNINNPDLVSEKAQYVESGVKYNNAGINATASYFYRNIKDFIDYTRALSTDAWQPNNYQHIQTQGFTFALDYKIINTGNEDLFSHTIVGISYTNLQPKIVKPASQENLFSQYAVSSLRNQLVGNVRTNIVKNLTVSLDGRYLQRISYKKYFLLDSKITYAISRKCKLYMEGTNLTNVTYTEAYVTPMVGKWYNVGATIQL